MANVVDDRALILDNVPTLYLYAVYTLYVTCVTCV